MTLETLLQSGSLLKHQATVAEVQKLLGLIDRELSDAAVKQLSADAQFAHAYDAALQLCTLALHVCGYKVVKGSGHHSRTINSLSDSLGEKQKDNAVYLSKCSTQRHHSIYDYVGAVSQDDADDLLKTAKQLRKDVLTWLKSNYPKLVPKGF